MTLEELTQIFKNLEANDPELWASSQIEEGIPQLARFLFLKGAWDGVVPDNDQWIDTLLEWYDDKASTPYSGQDHAVKRMIDLGVHKEDITELVRCVAAAMIFHIGYMLDDSSSVQGNDHVDWALMQVDKDENIITQINGIHESVLETDPTGREMMPKSRGKN